jgi:two-component system alkaline phosphatase synthesis response regulator PhoP
MLIDDDVELAEQMSAILRNAGYEVRHRDSTHDAIRLLVDEKPDLLVLDVMFPDNPVAGFDLARQIRCRREIRDLPIVLLTAVNQEFPMDFSAKDIDPEWMPVQDFVEKPVSATCLLETVRKILPFA